MPSELVIDACANTPTYLFANLYYIYIYVYIIMPSELVIDACANTPTCIIGPGITVARNAIEAATVPKIKTVKKHVINVTLLLSRANI